MIATPRREAPPDVPTGGSALRFVGQPTRRFDAPERLVGQTRFTADLVLPGALYARLVRSPHPAARIVAIDVEAARKMPGVVGVFSARDLPFADIERAAESRRLLLALDRVLYAGQPVAVVVADTEAAAADAAALVSVEYETLPSISDPRQAAMPAAPVVREQRQGAESELAMHGAASSSADDGGESREEAPNIASRARFHRGDVEAGFREADVVVEREFSTSWVHQGYIEPLAAAALTDALGSLTVYTTTQALFHVRNEVCEALGLKHHQVKVYAMPVGGGFGGKFGFLEPLVGALALAARRPVRLTYTREEELTASNPAPAGRFRVKIGARRDGTLTTLEADVLFDAGSSAGAPAGLAARMMGSTYRWKHLLVEGAEVLTNKAGTGAYRAPGVPQAVFALESTVDDVARELGLDPLELRLKNAVREGDLQADDARWPRIGLVECLERAREVYRRECATAGHGEGVGLALGGWSGGIEPASAVCRLNPDGTLAITLGAVDLSGTFTTFQMIAAEAFGLDHPGQVRVAIADTDAAPYAGATGGSKITYTVGPAVQRAAEDARQQVLKIAADRLEASMEDLEIVGGEVRVRGVPGRSMSLEKIAARSMSFGGRYEPVFGRGQAAITETSPAFAVHVVRVRVDPDTGRVTPVNYVCVQDAGRALNPAAVEGQMMGGAAQCVGWGLLEEMVFDASATPLTASLLDYALPRATQVPPMEPVVVEVASKIGPYGARPVGEPPVIPGAAAIANAVRDACGARVTDLPLTSERVFSAMTRSA